MEDKKFRKLKVYGQSTYMQKDRSTIVLKGKWLENAGFDIGNSVMVEVSPGELKIVKISN